MVKLIHCGISDCAAKNGGPMILMNGHGIDQVIVEYCIGFVETSGTGETTCPIDYLIADFLTIKMFTGSCSESDLVVKTCGLVKNKSLNN